MNSQWKKYEAEAPFLLNLSSSPFYFMELNQADLQKKTQNSCVVLWQGEVEK